MSSGYNPIKWTALRNPSSLIYHVHVWRWEQLQLCQELGWAVWQAAMWGRWSCNSFYQRFEDLTLFTHLISRWLHAAGRGLLNQKPTLVLINRICKGWLAWKLHFVTFPWKKEHKQCLHTKVQPLEFSTHPYSKHFTLDMWSLLFTHSILT